MMGLNIWQYNLFLDLISHPKVIILDFYESKFTSLTRFLYFSLN